MSDPRRYRWYVLAASVLMLLMANGAMFLIIVAMADISETFNWPRGVPSTAYAMQFVGGGLGCIAMGWWLDRAGMGKPALLGAIMIGSGAILTGMISSRWELWAIYGVMIGLLGTAAMFAPLMANITRWFDRNRGMAVGLVASGQSLAGFIWPPIFELGLTEIGWRATYVYYGIATILVMVPLSLVLRRSPPPIDHHTVSGGSAAPGRSATIYRLRPNSLLALLCCAIVGCCIAMSLPLAHLKVYATDVGIAPMQAATLLSVMLLASFVARAVFAGLLIGRFGALKALFLFSVIQVAMLTVLPFIQGLMAFYVVAAVFGFGYGGIGPCYPVIVREYLPERRAGRYTGIVVMFGTFGMAIGGWLGGFGYDMTGSYTSAFLAGTAFNVANLLIIGFLIGLTRTPSLRHAPA
ncbi:MAG: MFS transporter [Pseudomonadota bacterium]